MEYLSGLNLFTSHFIMGTRDEIKENTKTETNEIKALHDWLNFKNNDWAMEKFRGRTQYVAFLRLIDLKILNQLLLDLIHIYKKSYPYAIKDDFISHTFGYSLFDLERFTGMDLTYYGPSPNNNFDYYYYYDQPCGEFCDFAIPSNKTIDFYKQYYKKVIEQIKNITYDRDISTVNSKSSPVNQTAVTKKMTATKEYVERTFSFMAGKDPRTHKPILNENDYENLIDWITYYYENDFSLPDIQEPIKFVSTNKTYVQGAFRRFFKLMHPSKEYPKNLFNLYQSCFVQFENDKESNFYKATITLELEKLMNIR